MKFLQFNSIGDVVSFCECQDNSESFLDLPNMTEAPDGVNSITAFDCVVDPQTKSVLIPKKKRPGPYFRFSFDTMNWIPNTDALRSEIGRLANVSRDAGLIAPVSFEGDMYDANGVAVANIQSTLTMCQIGIQLPENFVWRTYDNKSVPMNEAKLRELASAIYARNMQCYQNCWAVKDLANATESTDELMAILNSIGA